MTDWETQVRKVKAALDSAGTADAIKQIWKENLVLGHRTLGRLLINTPAQVERLIARREDAE